MPEGEIHPSRLSKILKGLDLIFIPSSFFRRIKFPQESKGSPSYDREDKAIEYALKAVGEFGRISTCIGLYYQSFN